MGSIPLGAGRRFELLTKRTVMSPESNRRGSRGGNGVIDAESVRVYSEGPQDSMSRSLARYIQRVAALYVPSH